MDEEKRREERTETAIPTDALGAMLSDPAFIEKLKGVMSGLQGGQNIGASPAPTPSSTEVSSVSTSPLPVDGLAAVLSNPAMMEKLPAIIAALRPMMESAGAATPTVAPVAATHTAEHSRETLLVALKPFLSKERGDAIDTILRLSQLGSVLGQMK